MIFQVRTDNNIENSQELKDAIQAEVDAILGTRSTDQLRRVEVYLQDTNSNRKGGDRDKRCTVEAHLDRAGAAPVVATDEAETVEQAVDGALRKLLRALDSTLGRRRDRDDPISMSGQET